ncbi:McrB family protein [Fictibacillus barbaricus]|uniref:AAA family ATPase n=1 Tax=Fictibacillus barbaricus TaxID=182136 RepID=A0ABS2ZA70_9BACL|nr:AAA family ATPase [Fictibacillus barbaricus]MBN3545084.1 AAA family ATPase [Fictibacillus barbaricus]GGB61876.1 hypothetical protein GCM10007199_29670 [Fictibacillus barbaricus]
MNTTEIESNITTLEKWLETKAVEDISLLIKENLEQSFTKPSLNRFEKRLKNEVFGSTIVFRVESFETFNDKNKIERLKVNAVVMQPSKTGYTTCSHPIDASKLWYVSSVIQSNRFSEELKRGILFFASFRAAYDDKHLADLITFDLNSYKEIELSFTDLLKNFGGNQLVEAAQDIFGTDVEKVIAEKLLLASESTWTSLVTSEKEITKKRLSLGKREKAYEERLQVLEANEKRWIKILERTKEMIRLETEYELKNNIVPEEHEWDNGTIIKLLQSLIYHNSDDDLIYDPTIIESFLRGLQANILVVLSGPSGTGKSSLVTAVANTLKGAKSKIIPVQSSWTDTQDLLGYFNPLEKRFVASPFLEALSEAQEDSENLYFICLDEMNLAHVEYYFSEFLSAREQENPSIRLYSKRYFLDACRLIENTDLSEDISIEKREKYENAAELVTRYPHLFQIPKNVRFVGTLNMDHTVKPLSPKVIDRSLVIELNHPENSREIEEVLLKNLQTGYINVTVEQFTKQVQSTEDVVEYANQIMKLNSEIDSIPNARLNSRGYKQLVQYLTRVSNIEPTHIDQLLCTKLLPRIAVSRRDENEIKILEDFSGKILIYPKASQKFELMHKSPRTVQFW